MGNITPPPPPPKRNDGRYDNRAGRHRCAIRDAKKQPAGSPHHGMKVRQGGGGGGGTSKIHSRFQLRSPILAATRPRSDGGLHQVSGFGIGLM